MQDAWEKACGVLSERFGDGEPLDVKSIVFLVGVNELGQGYRKFSKDEKLDVMHIATCKLLSFWGYYLFAGRDADGWPHWELCRDIPELTAAAQEELLKKSIVRYLKEEDSLTGW